MSYFNRFLFSKHVRNIKNNFPSQLVRYEHDTSRLQSSHKVNNLEKKFLVWTGKYKNVSEVPPFVSQSIMERCRNRMRIKIANYMMAATAIGCIAMVYLGKQDAKKGVSLSQQNRDWHAEQKALQQGSK